MPPATSADGTASRPVPADGESALSRRAATRTLIAIVGVAAALRLYHLGRHFFWFDEGLLLNLDLLGKGAWGFTLTVWHTTTYNPGWAIVVWLTSRVAGVTLWAARFPSCLAGILNVALTYPAARALKLDRPTALAAAALTALAWPQVEYSQQILPYAAVPLMTTVILWLIAKLDRDAPARIAVVWCPLLALACTLDVANHNSFLMLVPFLGIALLAVAVRRGFVTLNSERRYALVALAVSFGWVVLVSLVFYLPKRGEGYRTYLDPYYVATFRDHAMGYGPFTDALYKHWVGRPNLVLDALYFGLSRSYDTFLYAANLFSPLYVTTPWGLLAALPVGLACAGVVASVRGRPGAAPRWLACGLLLTLGVLFALSAARLYPYGGIRQLLFLSPFVVLLTATGWRAALGRWPAVVGALTLAALGVCAVRAPAYYAQTEMRLDEWKIGRTMRATGIATVVIPDFGEHYFMLNHLTRNIARRSLLDTPWPGFTTLLHRHQPFLLYSSDAFPPSDFARGTAKSVPYRKLIGNGYDFGDYEVRPIIAERGGYFRGGEPNPGTFLYSFRPRVAGPELDAPGARARVVRTDPGDGTQSVRMVCDVAVAFSRAMDPATLTPQTVQLWSRPADRPDAPWDRGSYAHSATVDYDPAWNTAILQIEGPLKPALYRIVVTGGARDASGRPLDGEFASTFRLESPTPGG